MSTFWDHVFNALEHVADASNQAAQARAEEKEAHPRRKIKKMPEPTAKPSFDGHGGPGTKSTKEACCVTKARFKKAGGS